MRLMGRVISPAVRPTPDPFNRDLEAFTPAFAGHYHPLDDLSDNLFALRHRRRGGMPQGRNVVRELHDGLPLCRRERAGLRLHKALILLLQVPVGQ